MNHKTFPNRNSPSSEEGCRWVEGAPKSTVLGIQSRRRFLPSVENDWGSQQWVFTHIAFIHLMPRSHNHHHHLHYYNHHHHHLYHYNHHHHRHHYNHHHHLQIKFLGGVEDILVEKVLQLLLNIIVEKVVEVCSPFGGGHSEARGVHHHYGSHRTTIWGERPEWKVRKWNQ